MRSIPAPRYWQLAELAQANLQFLRNNASLGPMQLEALNAIGDAIGQMVSEADELARRASGQTTCVTIAPQFVGVDLAVGPDRTVYHVLEGGRWRTVTQQEFEQLVKEAGSHD